MGTEELLCGVWVEVEGPGRRRRVRRAARDFGKIGEKTKCVQSQGRRKTEDHLLLVKERSQSSGGGCR